MSENKTVKTSWARVYNIHSIDQLLFTHFIWEGYFYTLVAKTISVVKLNVKKSCLLIVIYWQRYPYSFFLSVSLCLVEAVNTLGAVCFVFSRTSSVCSFHQRGGSGALQWELARIPLVFPASPANSTDDRQGALMDGKVAFSLWAINVYLPLSVPLPLSFFPPFSKYTTFILNMHMVFSCCHEHCIALRMSG